MSVKVILIEHFPAMVRSSAFFSLLYKYIATADIINSGCD